MIQNGDGRANVVDILGVLAWFNCIVGENEPAPPPPPSPCQDVECGANSTCVVDEVDYLCNCDEGYSQVDDQCLPSFPCDTDETHACDYARATCNHEEAGRFSCTCTSGFEGDGLRDGSGCEDINPCVAETGPCADGVECTDVPAPDDGFACGDCPSGSTGDGATCTDIEDCTDSPCGENGASVDTGPNAYACDCNANYTTIDGTCAEVNRCGAEELNDCDPNAACSHASPNDHSCACNFGFIGNGGFCEEGADCQGQWGSWEDCSEACGGGIRVRPFDITTDATGVGACPNEGQLQTEDCNEEACPIDCVGDWSEWGECSESCGGGQQSREFEVSSPPEFGGICTHEGLSQAQDCNTNVCAPAPGSIVASVVLDMALENIADGSDERAAFEDAFMTDMAVALSVGGDRVRYIFA